LIERHQRRALPACGHVGRPEIADDGDAGQFGKPCPIADLPGAALVGRVIDGVTVEPDQVDLSGGKTRRLQQALHRRGMPLGQFGFDLCNRSLAAQTAAQPFAKTGIVGQGQKGAGLDLVMPIGANKGGVDAVERGSTHQAQGGIHGAELSQCVNRQTPDGSHSRGPAARGCRNLAPLSGDRRAIVLSDAAYRTVFLLDLLR
jgi:hypothetical protein